MTPENKIAPRTKAEIMDDLVREEKIEEDLISLYSALLESGVSECIDVDLIDVVYKCLNTLKDESAGHRKLVESILKKYQ